MSWLAVDTSVVSYILKKHSLAPAYWEILKGHRLGISFMTVAELYCWPLRRNWGEKRLTALRQHLRGYPNRSGSPLCYPPLEFQREGSP